MEAELKPEMAESARHKELRFLSAYYTAILTTRNLAEEWKAIYQERLNELTQELYAYDQL